MKIEGIRVKRDYLDPHQNQTLGGGRKDPEQNHTDDNREVQWRITITT